MSKSVVIGFLAGATCLTLACLCAPASILPSKGLPTAIRPETMATPVSTIGPSASVEPFSACVTSLASVLHESENSFLSGTELEKDFTLVTYTVSGDIITDPHFVSPIPPRLKVYQQDTAGQEKLWHFFTNIIPVDQRTQVTNFSVFTDGPSNSLGAVEQTDNPHDWILEMDIQDSQNFPDLSSTLVHEFGHLLTLNDTQVTTDLQVFNNPDDQEIYDRAVANCPNYFMFEGCSRPKSYINQFFQRFWPGIYSEWLTINAETDQNTLDQELDDFYQAHTDQFVSSYAVTSPEEDIAETFMYFIFTPKPSETSVAEQKILFFYGYPELVRLRERILANLCTYVEKP